MQGESDLPVLLVRDAEHVGEPVEQAGRLHRAQSRLGHGQVAVAAARRIHPEREVGTEQIDVVGRRIVAALRIGPDIPRRSVQVVFDPGIDLGDRMARGIDRLAGSLGRSRNHRSVAPHAGDPEVAVRPDETGVAQTVVHIVLGHADSGSVFEHLIALVDGGVKIAPVGRGIGGAEGVEHDVQHVVVAQRAAGALAPHGRADAQFAPEQRIGRALGERLPQAVVDAGSGGEGVALAGPHVGGVELVGLRDVEFPVTGSAQRNRGGPQNRKDYSIYFHSILVFRSPNHPHSQKVALRPKSTLRVGG